MEEINFWKNAFGHFKTITKHKMLVLRYCFSIGLYKQGLLHDLSKYSWTEFRVGIRYYKGYKSPNGVERIQTGTSTAWLHHKGRNKHHFEYWCDYDLKDPNRMIGCPMPYRYVAEMFCDRVAASKNYQGEKYYEDKIAVMDRNLITASSAGSLLWARYILENLELYSKETIEAWYNYFSFGKVDYFGELMNSFHLKM